jgi:hypothetical protein
VHARDLAPAPPGLPAHATEATEIHTRILRVALAIEESRAYLEHVDPAIPAPRRAALAFEQRWFGAKSAARVRFLVATLADRFDSSPNALAVLRRWRSLDAPTRQLVCHWHLQLSDPMYRAFTGDLLVQRRSMQRPSVDRDVALRWLRATFPDRWSEATCVQFASKLLSASLEAGLVSKRDPRSLELPRVPDHALAYLFYLLRETRFEGSLTDNPYLGSLGLGGEILDARARALPGLVMRRMMHLVDFEWAYPDLLSWGNAEVLR